MSINRFHTDSTYELNVNNTTFSGAVLSATAFPYTSTENTGYILRVGTASGDDSGFTPYLMVKAANGNVGIGNSSPGAKLQIDGNVVAYSFQSISGTSVTNQGAYMMWNAGIWSGQGRTSFINQEGGGFGGFHWLTYGSSNQFISNCAYLSRTGGLSLSSYSNVFTADGLLVPGKVGIGVNNPSANLHYFGGASSTTTNGAPGSGGVIIGSDATNGNVGDYSPVLHFRQSWYTQGQGSVSTGGIAGYKTVASGSFGGGLAFLYCANGATSLTQGMTLTDSGRLGIGTADPGALLHVYGTYSYWGAYQSENTSRQNGSVLQGASWNTVNNPGVTYYAPNFSIYAGVNSGAALWNFTSRPTHYASDLILTAGDCNDSGNNGSGPVNANGGSVYIQGGIAYCGGPFTAYPYVAGDIVFQTGATNGGNTDQTRYERMRIKGGSGYVSIGTTNSSAPLHIRGIVAAGINAFNYYNYTFPQAGVYTVILEYAQFGDTNICDGWNVTIGTGNNPTIYKISGNGAYLRTNVVSQYVVGFGAANSLPAGFNTSNYNLRIALLCAQ
jgi:hypothetical protein